VFAALGIQHAMRIRHILLPFAVSSALPYFSTLLLNWHDFLKKKILTQILL